MLWHMHRHISRQETWHWFNWTITFQIFLVKRQFIDITARTKVPPTLPMINDKGSCHNYAREKLPFIIVLWLQKGHQSRRVCTIAPPGEIYLILCKLFLVQFTDEYLSLSYRSMFKFSGNVVFHSRNSMYMYSIPYTYRHKKQLFY